LAGTAPGRGHLLTTDPMPQPLEPETFILLTEAGSPRLDHVTAFLFHDLLGCGLRVTQDASEFAGSGLCRINYTAQHRPDAFWIHPSGLLSEKGVHGPLPRLAGESGLPLLFPTDRGDLPFDILSAAFYLLSRYEEYLPHAVDAHGRFDHRVSLAWTGGFLDRPLVDEWAAVLRQALLQRFPAASLPPRGFRLLPTYDIDIAWAHRHRGAFRCLTGMAGSLLQGRLADVRDRLATLLDLRPDPYDAYGWLDRLHDRHGLEPLYFFLLAERWGRYDRNIPPAHPALQALLARHARRYRVGLHPSWRSGDEPGRLSREAGLLEDVAGPVRHARQHYLRFTLPDTFRHLIDAGIENDHSMGYGAANGFRASTCTPFRWYDLGAERATALTLHPFCFMDATAHHEAGTRPEAAFTDLMRYHDTIRRVGGQMVTIFHNSMLGTHPMYRGWRETYARFLEYAANG